jgi:protein TonB
VNRRRVTLIVFSLLLHVGALMGTGMIPVPEVVEQVMVTMRVTEPEPPEPPEPAPEPEPLEEEAAEAAAEEPEAEPEQAPEPEPPQEAEADPSEADPPASDDVAAADPGPPGEPANFGVVLSGTGGPGGIAVATGRPDGVRGGTGTGGSRGGSDSGAAVERVLASAEPTQSNRRDRCTGETRDLRRPRGIRRASYPDAALREGISARVRVRIEVDERGMPQRLQALDTPGFGLEDAAVEALRDVRFEPATRCGRAIAADTIISIRFERE